MERIHNETPFPLAFILLMVWLAVILRAMKQILYCYIKKQKTWSNLDLFSALICNHFLSTLRVQRSSRPGGSACRCFWGSGVSKRGTHVLKGATITQAACGLLLAAKSSHSVCISDFSPRVI